MVVRLASVGPLLLVFEDLHAAGASIEALQYIVRRLAATPTLIVATYRTTEVERHHPIHRMLEELRGSRRFASLTLGPLSRSEHRNLLTSLLGDVPVSDLVVDHLYATTEGNPFFTGEVVRSLLSNETAAEGADTWLLLSPSHLSSALPATIQQAIDRRLGRLPEALREILVCATVIGKTFDARELEQLAREGDDLDEAIDRLVQEGLLVEERSSRGDRLSFASGVVREVLYAQIPRRRRRGLHRRYATYLEGRYANRIERVYAQLLHHYAEGDVPDQSVLYGIRAARQSIAAFNPDEAIRAARTALEFLDEEWQGDPAAHGEVRELLAAAYRMNGNLDGALREAEAAITVYRGLGRPADEVRCLLLAGAHRLAGAPDRRHPPLGRPRTRRPHARARSARGARPAARARGHPRQPARRQRPRRPSTSTRSSSSTATPADAMSVARDPRSADRLVVALATLRTPSQRRPRPRTTSRCSPTSSRRCWSPRRTATSCRACASAGSRAAAARASCSRCAPTSASTTATS